MIYGCAWIPVKIADVRFGLIAELSGSQFSALLHFNFVLVFVDDAWSSSDEIWKEKIIKTGEDE